MIHMLLHSRQQICWMLWQEWDRYGVFTMGQYNVGSRFYVNWFVCERMCSATLPPGWLDGNYWQYLLFWSHLIVRDESTCQFLLSSHCLPCQNWYPQAWIPWNLLSFIFYSMKKDSKRCCDTTTPESIHTKDESKRSSAIAFIFGVNLPVQSM